MARNSAVDAIQKLQTYNKIKQRQVVCPITGETLMLSPLTVGDDLSLRTMLSSPDVYDSKLVEVIYNHTEFIDRDERPPFNAFVRDFSDFDRHTILWGIYAATYNSFGNQDIECTNCGNQWQDEIKADDVIQDDFVTMWDKDQKFTEYVYPIEVPFEEGNEANIEKIVFNTQVPSFKKHMDILNLLDQHTLNENYEQSGALLSTSEQLALVTSSLEVHGFPEEVEEEPEEEQSDENEEENKQSSKKSKSKKKKPEKQIDEVKQPVEIYQIVKQFILLDTVNEVVDKYQEEFDKYTPKFRKPYTCENCGNQFDFDVNVEVALFRKFLRF